MNIDQITSLISSVGFPIVMCGLLLYYISNITKTFAEGINNMTTKFTESIDQNHDILIKIQSYIEKEESTK